MHDDFVRQTPVFLILNLTVPDAGASAAALPRRLPPGFNSVGRQRSRLGACKGGAAADERGADGRLSETPF